MLMCYPNAIALNLCMSIYSHLLPREPVNSKYLTKNTKCATCRGGFHQYPINAASSRWLPGEGDRGDREDGGDWGEITFLPSSPSLCTTFDRNLVGYIP